VDGESAAVEQEQEQSGVYLQWLGASDLEEGATTEDVGSDEVAEMREDEESELALVPPLPNEPAALFSEFELPTTKGANVIITPMRRGKTQSKYQYVG
jgi:hypothetical protein